jgi:hypothetical protein
MNEFPKMLFRCPGPIVWEGIAHEHCIVDDGAAEDAAVADGWHDHPAKAKAAHEAKAEAEAKAAEAAKAPADPDAGKAKAKG